MDSIDIALYVSYTLTALAAIAAVGFPIINSMNDPKSMVKAGMGVGALLVVFLLSWLISGDEVTAVCIEFDVNAGVSKMIGGALTMMYLMIFLALGGIVFTEVSKSLK